MARDLGAAALATGHYARRLDGPSGAELHRAVDPTKDQSYFLFATTPAQLDFVRFPLGTLDKATTRIEAERLALPVAAKPESQDICFVPDGHYSSVVGKLEPRAMRKGAILHVDGRRLGEHAGIGNYTVGQRRGIGVAAAERLYVVGLDAETDEVRVGPRHAGMSRGVRISECNRLGPWPPGRSLQIKHRYNEPAVEGRIANGEGQQAELRFVEPQSGVAPGQAAVLYDGERILGGGWIDETVPADSSIAKAATVAPLPA